MADAPTPQLPSPEVKSAIQLGVIAEVLLLAVGGAIAFVTGQMLWIIVGAIAGSAVMIFLLARAGAFTKKND